MQDIKHDSCLNKYNALINTCTYPTSKYSVFNLAFTLTELYAHIIWQTYLLLTGYRPSTKGGIKEKKIILHLPSSAQHFFHLCSTRGARWVFELVVTSWSHWGSTSYRMCSRLRIQRETAGDVTVYSDWAHGFTAARAQLWSVELEFCTDVRTKFCHGSLIQHLLHTLRGRVSFWSIKTT